MTTSTPLANAPDLTADDYIVIGLSTSYLKSEGELEEVTLAEPVPSAYLEALLKGVPTSYRTLHATTLGAVIEGENSAKMLDAAPAGTQFCPDFVARAIATSRTYLNRPDSKTLVPVGSTLDAPNYSTERKRILNAEHVVNTEDNVKQHAYTHQVL